MINRTKTGAALAALVLLAAACGGPQMKMLADRRYKALEPGAKVEVYIGEIKPPYQEVAIIESDTSAYEDAAVKKNQLNELKVKARKLGANAVQNVHILAKRVKGYTIDERVPFTAWQQGQYDLYYMRGIAIRVPESEPTTVEEARPTEGWLVDNLKPPTRLDEGTTATATMTPAPQPTPVTPPSAAATPAPLKKTPAEATPETTTPPATEPLPPPPLSPADKAAK